MCPKPVALFLLLFFNVAVVFAQRPPEEFFKGLDDLKVNKPLAKADMLASVNKDPAFHGAYHFLGVLCFENRQLDSAVYYFKKAIDLNKANVNHTREMSYARLIEMYAYQHNFDTGFKTAWEAYNLYPDSNSIPASLSDLCLWAFYIKHGGFDDAYLSPDAKAEYVVKNVPQEYLIVRWLYADGQQMQVASQALQFAGGNAYDILTCIPNGKTEVDAKKLKFKLDWDFNKEFGGRPMPTTKVVADKTNPIYERIGALLTEDKKMDLKAKIEELIKE